MNSLSVTDFLPLIPKTFDNTIMHQCEKRLIKISECERSCERGRSNKSTNRRRENSRDTYRYASDDGDKHKSPERMMSFALITGLPLDGPPAVTQCHWDLRQCDKERH